MSSAARDVLSPLLGREPELARLRALLDVDSGGGSLVLRGEPGIGKSRLAAEATALAVDAGFRVLSTSGVQSEARIGFAGLHQLVRPERGRVAGLPSRHRAALDAAFGLSDDAAPDRFQIGMAVLDLLSEAATDAPVLVVAEDAHWLDQPSAEVLAFVARRVESDPIAVLATAREGYRSPLTESDLPELDLQPLGTEVAEELLDVAAPALAAPARREVLREAAGNPLALIELPSVAAVSEPGVVPITERLERAFAARAADLAFAARVALLVAALNDRDDLGEILDAARLAAGEPVEVSDLAAAAEAAIVELDLRSVRFRHPLARSAISQSAPVGLRRQVHEALAQVLAGDPDRQVWHRAALLSGEQEDVACALEEAGRRAQRRGAPGAAVAALRRAGELSAPEHRCRRLLAAARLAQELGRPDVVSPLLREVDRLDPTPRERARATWITEVGRPRALRDGKRATALVATAEEAGLAGDDDLRIDLLWLVAQRAWWADPGADARRRLVAATDALGGGADTPDPRIFAIYAYANPLGHAPEVIARLRADALERHHDVDAARHFGPAATVAGGFGVAAGLLDEAVEGLRREGRVGHLPRMLALQGMVSARMGRWDVAIPAAEESRRLSLELGERLWEAGADTVGALIAGMRGDEAGAEQQAAAAERRGLALGADFIVAMAQIGRSAGRLGAGRQADAYMSARRVFDPADPAYHPTMRTWLLMDYAEAASSPEEVDEVRAMLDDVERCAGDEPGDWIALGLRHARAVTAGDDAEAGERFAAALAADLSLWPFQRARLELAHGRWLRRQRRIGESRVPLRAARDAFDALGCVAWGEQARRELRASGETSRRRNPDARDELTAQELQIAQLAASGLSNREIGERLYLSHRTVGTHLYRIFPKLGITARGELAGALGRQ
ncbi:MAG TPA: LuxR family transcriptional regulator [Baekduia sp.]